MRIWDITSYSGILQNPILGYQKATGIILEYGIFAYKPVYYVRKLSIND